MRIGIDCRGLKNNFMSGADRYLINFLKLAIRERPDHEFFLYGNQHSYLSNLNQSEYVLSARLPAINLKDKKVTIKITPEWNTQWWDHVILGKEAKKDKLDVFFSPFDKASVLSPCPIIITIHDPILFGTMFDK
ncbi:MAG: hypothetical protein ACE5KZ_11995 [Candidatus Scalinduaceae bacterium]